MALINVAAREIHCKIVYYGPGMSGKTTNLQYIHQQVPQATKGDLLSIATETERTLFFDFLPLDLVHRPPVEVWLTLAGWVMILGFAIPHYIAVAVFYPNAADPVMRQWLWIARTISFSGLMIAAVLTFVASYLYYRWTSE